MNLFASLKEVLTEELTSQIAAQNNEKPEKIQKAMEAIGASIVGGLIKRVTTESGMNLVFNQINKTEVEPNNFNQLFGIQTEVDTLKSAGDKDFNALLPGLKSAISGLAAKYAGTRNSLSTSLCGLTMSIVVSVLKTKIKDRKLDSLSLAAYLGEQREGVLNAVPAITDLLIESVGIKYLFENFSVPKIEKTESQVEENIVLKKPTPFLVESPEESATDFSPYLKWIGIGVLIIGVIVGGIYFWNQRQNLTEMDTDTAPVEAKTIEEVAPTKDTLAKQTPISSTPTNADSPMSRYLADTTLAKGKAFKFENVDFEDNTTQLKPTPNPAVQALADLLKKYPNAQIKLVGYANDARPPMTNKTLSVKRVFAIKDQFIKSGISYVRIDAEGRGTGINPRDTTGRKQVAMREVWVKFVQK